MKIAYFCNEYPPRNHGGIGTFVKTLAEGMAKLGHKITVVEFGDVEGIRLQNSVTVVTLLSSRIPKIAWLINRYHLRNWIVNSAKNKYIEIFELPEYQGWLPMPIKNYGVKVIVRLHLSVTAIRHFANEPKRWIDYINEYLTLFFHENWIGVSEYIFELTQILFNLKSTKTCIIYNPLTIDQSMIADLPNERAMHSQYVLFVGSMTERKGVIVLAHAAKKIMKENKSLSFVFAGPITQYRGKPITDEIVKIIDNDQCVIFTGQITHTKALHWMRDALTVVLPSKLEAFGLVPIEAMALGTPVIYSATGPGPEIIQNGVNGILVDPVDSKAIGQHIMHFIKNPTYCTGIAMRGKEFVNNKFNVDKIFLGNVEYYTSISANT